MSWHHIAITRSNGEVKHYLDGVDHNPTPVKSKFKGWIDELRISKGIARWKGNFTPPTNGVSILFDGFENLTDNTIANDNTIAKVDDRDPIQKIIDGEVERLNGNPTTDAGWHLGTGDFTIDCWVKPEATKKNSRKKGIRSAFEELRRIAKI